MGQFNRGQWVFVAIMMGVLTVMVASVSVYFLNGVSLRRFFKIYRFSMLFQVLTDSNVRSDIRLQGLLALAIGFGVSLVAMLGLMIQLSTQKVALFGNAKFASDADIRRSKVVTWGDDSKGGVIIGLHKGKLLRYIAPDFISMGAGTRAGKGAAVVIPNLLSWLHSMIVLDPKQECYKITSKFRQLILGHKVYLLDPFSSKTHGFNPLFYIDLASEKGAGYLKNLAETVWPSVGLSGPEAHFNSAASRVFVGFTELLYYLIKYDKKFLASISVKPLFSIGTVMDLYFAVDQEALLSDREALVEMSQGNANDTYIINDALNKIKKLFEAEGEAKSSTEETFQKKLDSFTLPLFRAATDRNDFDLRELRKKKITVYIGVNADDAKIADSFLNLFFNFAIDVNMRENPDFVPENKNDVLFLLDEFPSIGAMHYIKKASGFIAGFKLKLLTIYQNIAQLIEIYGLYGAKSLMANHPCRVIYAVSEKEDADEVSAKLGYTTLKNTGKSKNRSKGGLSRGESESDAQRALVLPQELSTLKFEEEFILLKGENPIKCKKAFYYNNHYFMDKLVSVSPKLEVEVKKLNRGTATGRKGLNYPSKEVMLSLGELEAELF